jgi:subtilisin family serine protease
MKNLLVFTLSFCFLSAWGQNAKLRVYFTDKGEQVKLLDSPRLFLSEKAIGRRAKQGIAITSNDLPVAPSYLRALTQRGAKIYFASRWFNYALVDNVKKENLQRLPFVRKVEAAQKHTVQWAKAPLAQQNIDYGLGQNQIEMLNGEALHQLGFTGQGVTIAVLDGGFVGTPNAAAFDSLRADGRLLGTHNFVDDSLSVYTNGRHGSYVLSCMAAIVPNQLVGTAPHASYWLLKSEDERSETPTEMDNWLAAAEFADSVGADVINSSLGYSLFDDSADNLSYQDMDGNTTLVTRAADKAAQKGIIVVTSAGNAGSSPWQYITAPADADSVLTVGAVEPTGLHANFSGQGPTVDQRIKPDVVAQGAPAAIIGANGDVSVANGTSFSSPIVAGLMACLVQAAPGKSNMDLINQVRRSASQYTAPDGFLGYGIPNFNLAYQLSLKSLAPKKPLALNVYPLPFKNKIHVQLKNAAAKQPAQLRIVNVNGQAVWQRALQFYGNAPEVLTVNLPAGLYFLQVKTENKWLAQKIWR